MQVVDIPVLRCHRCAYAWRPSQVVVKICPRCKSKNWDRPKINRESGAKSGLGMSDIIGGKRESVLRIARRHGATDIRIFGSVRRGQATSKSDVDLLVRFGPDADIFDQIHLEQELAALLHRKVEVVTVAGLHPLVRPQALFEATAL